MKYTKEQCEKKIAKWQKRLEECNTLEVGKWYRDHQYSFLFCYQGLRKGKITAYGFDANEWCDFSETQNWGRPNNEVLATDKEVEEALIKEAKKRGFKEGVDCEWTGENIVHRKLHGDFNYNKSINFLCIGMYIIFQDGKWAEIIEDPVYEYQWLYEHEDKKGLIEVGNSFYTKEYCKNKHTFANWIPIKPIEETKRIRK